MHFVTLIFLEGEKKEKHRLHEISRDVLAPHTCIVQLDSIQTQPKTKAVSGMSCKYIQDLENRVSLAH